MEKVMSLVLYEFDKQFRENRNKVIVGIDEVGRGPLAGPVVVGAVVLPYDFYEKNINDSKKLSENIRLKLDKTIRKNCLDYSLVIISPAEIDKINIRQATLKGMRIAIHNLIVKPDLVLVDGEKISQMSLPQKKIIKGDAKSLSIASASIIAKVLRDKIMELYHHKFPEYEFDKHKGYGTDAHRRALVKYGPSPIHRQSFLGNLQNWK